MLTELQLMNIHAKVLFKHDIDNRLTTINEPPFDLAPKIFIGVTTSGNTVRFLNSLDKSIVVKLQLTIGTNTCTELGEVIRILTEGRQVNNFWMGPAYVFPVIKGRTWSNVIQVTHENKELLKLDFPFTYKDFKYKEPCFVVIKDNKPVSICCSSRQTSKASEASVYTHEDYRGKGYGIEVTNAWAAEVQKQGRIALYSTSWDNFASQALAKKLVLIQYGIDIHMS